MLLAHIWQENGKRLYQVSIFRKYCYDIKLLRNGREAILYFHETNKRAIMRIIGIRGYWHGLKYQIRKKLKKEGR